MPELPEVENVRRTLAPHLLGRKITLIEIYVGRMIKWPDSDKFVAELTGRLINNLLRRGKYLLFDLDNDKLLVVHLRMTGALVVTPTDQPPPYARIRFALSDGSSLWYTDVRTLGTLHLLSKGENIIKGLKGLGPEPLAGQLDLAYLRTVLAKRKSTIKGLLLDQSVIAGIGNIYADEALAVAGIRPDRKANEISAKESKKLFEAIIKVIAQGIENRGTSFRDYKDGDGKKGSNQEHLLVYGRGKKPCHECQTPIEYVKVAGRGTCYCPKCQK